VNQQHEPSGLNRQTAQQGGNQIAPAARPQPVADWGVVAALHERSGAAIGQVQSEKASLAVSGDTRPLSAR